MLMKDSQIKLKKEIPGFALPVGTVFVIDEIVDGGMIQFSCTLGNGLMSWNEFSQYFEEYAEDKSQKEGQWSDWFHNDKFSDDCGRYDTYYRCRGREIQSKVEINFDSRSIECKAIAKCSPYDEFNLDKGIEISFVRALKKVCNAYLNHFDFFRN